MGNGEFKVTDLSLPRQMMAEDVVTDILKGKFPDAIYLRDLYGQKKSWELIDKIEEFIGCSIVPYLKAGNELRYLDDIRNSELYIKHHEAQELNFFFRAEDKITKWNLPDNDLFVEFYGKNYAPYVKKTWNAFNDWKVSRNCGLPGAMHLLRSSVMAKSQGFDKNSQKPANYYTTFWGIHDGEEDLLDKIRDKNGKLVYGIERFPQFVEDFVPEDMQNEMTVVTNTANVILSNMKINEKRFDLNTKKGMQYGLNALLNSKKYSFFYETLEEMLDVLEKSHLKSGRDLFYADMKWEFYKNIYIKNMATYAYENNYLAAFEGKGTVDLFENNMSILAEDIVKSRRALLKTKIWVDEADGLLYKMNAQNIGYPSSFQDHLWQVMNFANFKAREFLINYFAEPMSNSSHVKTGLKSIDILKPVLYTKTINK